MSSIEQSGEPTSRASQDETSDMKLPVVVVPLREHAGQELPS